ncbi:MAG: efflux RND transporter periplasmic adaptor subunit, partial [Synechococcales cyanobacterium RU_4_20]|nr:efflux RND transporter periplasmic adaptor subunit [Synechococcales cyanobacterium RU_4_20]
MKNDPRANPISSPSPLDPRLDPRLDSSIGPGITGPAANHPPAWRRFGWPAIGVLAVLGGLGWIVFSRIILPLQFAKNAPPPPPTPVQLASPKTSAIEDSSDYAASLDSRESVTLQSRVNGQIAQIYVKSGDLVKAGQPLMQLDATEQQAQVASRALAAETAAADIAAAQADVENAIQTLSSLEARRASAQSDVQFNQREYDRFKSLRSQGAISQQNLEQRLNTLRVAQARLSEAEAELSAQESTINRSKATVARSQRAYEQSQANISEGQARLQDYQITAPFSGLVSDIPAKVGDGVSNTTPLLTLTQNQELEVQIQVPLERASALRKGLAVQLLNDDSQVLQTGLVSFVSPDVDPTTQSIQVKASFQNSGNLRTSQFVRARLIWKEQTGLLVATSAISRLGGKDFIFVATPYSSSACGAAAAPSASPAGVPGVAPDQLVADQRLIR